MRFGSFAFGACVVLSMACARESAHQRNSLTARSSSAEVARFVRATFAELLPQAPLRRQGDRFVVDVPAGSFRRAARLGASLGATAGAPLQLTAGEVAAEVVSLDVRDVAGELDGGVLVFRNALPSTHVVQSVDGARFEELRVLTGPEAPRSVRYALRANSAISAVRVREGRVELLDRAGAPRMVAAPMIAIDAKGTRRMLRVEVTGPASDATIVGSLDASGLEYPITIDPSWTRVSNWSRPADGEPTSGALAVTTGDRVLVIGGDASTGSDRVDLYNPAIDSWSVVGSLSIARHGHMAANLAGGKVVVFGGQDPFANVLSTAEMFDPVTLTWSKTGSLLSPRYGGYAITLTDGRVLLAGGTSPAGNVTTAETFDPTSGKWAAAGTMPVSGGNSYVLVDLFPLSSARAVGFAPDPTTGTNYTAILYNPVTNAWSPGKAAADFTLSAAQVFGAKVVAVGSSALGNSSAVYDSGTNTWSTPTALPSGVPWSGARLVRVTTGNVVSVGYSGSSTGGLFDVTTQMWSALDGSTVAYALGAVPLSGGRAFFADTNGGQLFGTFVDGALCSTADQCSSGFCVDGVCCKSACTAQCQACNEPGKVGTCVTIAGAPRGTRTGCGGTDCPGSCDGAALACSPAPVKLACGLVSCAGSTFTGLGHCSGTDTSCVAPPSTACAGNFACASGTACNTSCAGDADCATGFHCASSACVADVDAGSDTGSDVGVDTGSDTGLADTGAPDTTTPDTMVADTMVADTDAPDTTVAAPDIGPPPTDAPAVEPTSSYKLCTSPGDCSSGFCVEGVCCDSACDQACHSCALPAAPGRCTLVPLGNDPRHDCSSGNACSQTCGGNGKCVTAFAGSQCAPSKCTGPTQGEGAAYCPSAGAKCPTAALAAFDCSPYACAPAFGACLTTCARSDQCAPGYACDSASRSCLTATPDAAPAKSGCGYGGVSGHRAILGGSLLALVLGLSRRRRARGEGRRHA